MNLRIPSYGRWPAADFITVHMHLTGPEALALLERWRNEQAELEVTSSSANGNRRELARVAELHGASVTLASDSGELTVNLAHANFNGDHTMPPASKHAAYLVCEFRNDDRLSMYALRG